MEEMILFITALIMTIVATIVFIFLTIKAYSKKKNNKRNRKIISFDDSKRKKDNYSLFISVCGFFVSVIGVILTLLFAVPAPTIYSLDNEARVYNETAKVIIKSYPFLTTYYTLDGSDPEFGYAYEDAFTIAKTTTVSAKNKFLIFWSGLSQNTFRFENVQNITVNNVSSDADDHLTLEGLFIYIIIILMLVIGLVSEIRGSKN